MTCPTSPLAGHRWRERLGDVVRPPPPHRHPLRRLDPAGPAGFDAAAPPGLAARRWQVPDDPVLHACIVTYASDMTLLDTALLPHGGAFMDARVQMASLDHAMWFHRPFRADEWLLYDQDTPSASDARGIARGLIYTQAGDLVVSVVQEGLIRPVDPKESEPA